MSLQHTLLAMIRFTDAGGSALLRKKSLLVRLTFSILSYMQACQSHRLSFTSIHADLYVGLPAVRLAIYLTAKPKSRNRIKGLLLSATLITLLVEYGH